MSLKSSAVVSGFLFAALLGAAAVPAETVPASACTSPDARSDNEAWTSRSWDFFNKKNYPSAIANVEACLPDWLPKAQRVQADLDAKGAMCPAEGAPDANTRKSILANGMLNDVATNLWIKGRSHDLSGNKNAAKEAYAQCQKLRCARTWDERGWFWDPAKDCSIRLSAIR